VTRQAHHRAQTNRVSRVRIVRLARPTIVRRAIAIHGQHRATRQAHHRSPRDRDSRPTPCDSPGPPSFAKRSRFNGQHRAPRQAATLNKKPTFARKNARSNYPPLKRKQSNKRDQADRNKKTNHTEHEENKNQTRAKNAFPHKERTPVQKHTAGHRPGRAVAGPAPPPRRRAGAAAFTPRETDATSA